MQQPDAPTSSQAADPLPSPSTSGNAAGRKALIFLLKAVIVLPLGLAVLWMEYQIAALLLDALMGKPYVLTGTELGWTRNAMWAIIVLGSIFYFNRLKFD